MFVVLKNLPLTIAALNAAAPWPHPTSAAAPDADRDVHLLEGWISTQCLDCHNAVDQTAGLDLETLSAAELQRGRAAEPREVWEKAYRRVMTGQMPPPDWAAADESIEDSLRKQEATGSLRRLLDAADVSDPVIPPVAPVRRMTRVEYQNSIRDLLAVPIDVSDFLPEDPGSDGFDNLTTADLSPGLLDRYLTAAETIAGLAVGRGTGEPTGWVVRVPADLTQEGHLDGLPPGTRGGVAVMRWFARAGDYRLAVRLARDRDEMIEGLTGRHEIDVLVDGHRRHRFIIDKPKNADDTHVDASLNVTLPIEAGQHEVAVTFPGQGPSLMQIKRQPFDAAFNRHRHPRTAPAIFEVSSYGPLNGDETASRSASVRSPSYEKLFIDRPDNGTDAEMRRAAIAVLRPIIRRAFRREVTAADMTIPLDFFKRELNLPTGRGSSQDQSIQDQFERGIEAALAAILVNPNFLFRIETSPKAEPGKTYASLNNHQLAARLAAFLWSSLPDDELLDVAAAGKLTENPAVLERQVRRMLADPRSSSLTDHFAAQWLHLRNLDSLQPDLRLFPDFDDNLRQAMRQETEALFNEIRQSNQSVLDLLRCDHTYLNERLAKHYDIPGIVGSHFRRVDLPTDSHRGGLLRHASLLAVTSYATRTSPTIRGNWVLGNLIGTPPPPPPPGVSTLKEKTADDATVRQRLAAHRADPSCASCHSLMDPIGFALDQYDAVGRWRVFDDESTIDTSGQLPDGTEVNGVADLEASLLANPEVFVTCLSEKLMTFALGRPVDHRDAAAIRRVVDAAAVDDFSFSSIVLGVATSRPFRCRSSL